MKRTSFDEWFAEVVKIGEEHGYKLAGASLLSWEYEHWEKLWKRGVTPLNAWRKG